MVELIRGRWSKRYINSFEDKERYDVDRRNHFAARSSYAQHYVA